MEYKSINVCSYGQGILHQLSGKALKSEGTETVQW